MKGLHFKVLFFAVLIATSCNNKPARLESKIELIQENAISYSTSTNGNIISYLETSTNKQKYINKIAGDTSILPHFLGFENILSPTGDTLIYHLGNTLHLYDIRSNSISTIMDSNEYRYIRVTDLSDNGYNVLMLARSLHNTEIICYNIKSRSKVILKTLTSNGIGAAFSNPRFNRQGSKVAFSDFNEDGVWSTFIMNLLDKSLVEIENEIFFSWVDNPEGIIALSKKDKLLKPIFIPNDEPGEKIELLHEINIPGQIGGEYNGIPYLSTWENNNYVEVLFLSSDTIIETKGVETKISRHSKVIWGRNEDNFLYVTGQGLPGNIFEINSSSLTNGFSKIHLNNVYRFGGHAMNLEISPNGKYCLFQGRLLFKESNDLNDNGVFIYELANGTFVKFHASKGNCPGEDCYEWPTWLNNKEIVYVRWYNNSIETYNLETGVDSVIYTSNYKGVHTSIAHLSTSPNGVYVAFIEWSANDNKFELMMVPQLLGQV
jgi:hypothetical protein